jgi:hypothetical protein
VGQFTVADPWRKVSATLFAARFTLGCLINLGCQFRNTRFGLGPCVLPLGNERN